VDVAVGGVLVVVGPVSSAVGVTVLVGVVVTVLVGVVVTVLVGVVVTVPVMVTVGVEVIVGVCTWPGLGAGGYADGRVVVGGTTVVGTG